MGNSDRRVPESSCLRNQPLFRRTESSSWRLQRGFTLIEMLVSLAVTAIIAVLLIQSMVKTAKRTHEEFQERKMLNAARMALARVVRELEGLGLNTYASPALRQPKLIYAGPFQIVFNADLDADLLPNPDPNDANNPPRLGPIKVDADDFTEVGDPGGVVLYDPNDSFTRGDVSPPDLTAGAETIRIGLDANLNGKIEPFNTTAENDSEDDFWGLNDLVRFASANPVDHVLLREVTGYSLPEDDNVRRWELLAVGLRPWLISPDLSVSYGYPSDPDFSDFPPFAPPLLFQYWGYFCQQDDGSGPKPRECLFQDANDDGRIDIAELTTWSADEVAAGQWSEADPPDPDPNNPGGVLPGSGGDENADGIQNRSMEEVLTKIVVTINLEAPVPSHAQPNMRRSDVDGDGVLTGTERPYYFKDVTVSQTVVLRNIRLDGTNTEDLGL
jgi:prepilin-type N-terminal cleavage/methylation domain-containing protein